MKTTAGTKRTDKLVAMQSSDGKLAKMYDEARMWAAWGADGYADLAAVLLEEMRKREIA